MVLIVWWKAITSSNGAAAHLQVGAVLLENHMPVFCVFRGQPPTWPCYGVDCRSGLSGGHNNDRARLQRG